MKTSLLQKILEDAKICAHISVTLSFHYTFPGRVLDVENAATAVVRFAQAGKIAIIENDREKSTLIIAKTPIFMPQDAVELASHIAEFVSVAVARDIPEHKISLEQGETGWQLKCEGGNKLLRNYFKLARKAAEKHFQLDATVLSDKDGVAVLDLSKGSDDAVLRFSEKTAEIFATQLVL